MLIVTGSVHAGPDTIDQVLQLSLTHVRRSREEPGCLLHSVHRDAEDPLRVVFLEHWVDEDALRQHFRVPESGEFMKALGELASRPPEMTVYEGHPLSL